MRKYKSLSIGLSSLTLLGLCFIFHPGAQAKSELVAPTKEEQRQQYQQMLDSQAERAKRADALLTKQEEQHQQYVQTLNAQAEYMKRAEAVVAKQEEFMKRYEKILNIWEAQQQQYQRYLDTLPKK
jgi:hypothetical protein